MKIVRPKFLLNGRYTEVYGLEDLYHPWSKNKSLTACYLLCKNNGLAVKKLSIEAYVPEIGTPAPWSVTYDAERFAAEETTLAGFLRASPQGTLMLAAGIDFKKILTDRRIYRVVLVRMVIYPLISLAVLKNLVLQRKITILL